MPINSVEIMRTIDDNSREMQKTTKEKQTKTERSNGNRSYSKRVRAKLFCCAFKSGFLQLMCKSSLIFKSSLELTLSIILKQRELYESKHVVVECRCLKIWDLLFFLICSSILGNNFISKVFSDLYIFHHHPLCNILLSSVYLCIDFSESKSGIS